MTESELSRVNEFQIKSQGISMKFLKPVNLCKVDFTDKIEMKSESFKISDILIRELFRDHPGYLAEDFLEITLTNNSPMKILEFAKNREFIRKQFSSQLNRPVRSMNIDLKNNAIIIRF